MILHCVILSGVPTIISNLPPVLYTEVNTTLTLTCTAQNVSIAWYHENVPLATGGSDNTLRHRTIGNGLEIPNLDLQQAGWYTCVASNQFGRAERDFLVVVGGEEKGGGDGREGRKGRKKGMGRWGGRRDGRGDGRRETVM